MLCINMYGSPSTGKSSFASLIFHKLKSKGINCELVTEVAKDMVWDGDSTALKDQLVISGNQNYRLSRLADKVDIAITDAPILLQLVYYRMRECPEPDLFEKVMYGYYSRYNNINYLLPINLSFYNPIGRIHDSSQIIDIDTSIKNLLSRLNVEYEEVGIVNNDGEKIANDIISRLEILRSGSDRSGFRK